jgi:hypothetical protein
MTNTQLVSYLLTTQQERGTTYYVDSVSGKPVDLRPVGAPTSANAGTPLITEFKYDLMGADRTLFGWSKGTYEYVPETAGNAK